MSEAWTGRKEGRWLDGGTARIFIVLVFAVVGPPVGMFWYVLGCLVAEKGMGQAQGLAVVAVGATAGLFFFSWFFAIVPAFLTGIGVAMAAPRLWLGLVASLVVPAVVYALANLANISFTGMALVVFDSPVLALPLTAIAAALTCWLLTIPLQRRA
ncbi:MAG: hypothetical protein R3D32_03975 [Nitratireductor sp.]